MLHLQHQKGGNSEMSSIKSRKSINCGSHEGHKRSKRSVRFLAWQSEKDARSNSVGEYEEVTEENVFNRYCYRCEQTRLIVNNNLCNVCVEDLGGL